MKALRRNLGNLLAVALASVGVLGLSLVSQDRSDLLAGPFSILVLVSRTLGSAAAAGVLYRWASGKKPASEPVRVPVRV